MVEPERQKRKSSLSEGIVRRLPRLGRLSQLLLLVGISAIIIVTLWIVYQNQAPKRAELQQTLVLLQQTLASTPKQEALKDTLMMEIKSVEAETELAEMSFSATDQSPELLDKLLNIAQPYNIDIIAIRQSTAQNTITVGGSKFQVLTFDLQIKGQVADFQNYMLDIESKLPTSQINSLGISIAAKEGEQDRASITIDVFCK